MSRTKYVVALVLALVMPGGENLVGVYENTHIHDAMTEASRIHRLCYYDDCHTHAVG
jgi:hypothetical protein